MTGCLKFVENQMANTFFGFNTALNEHGERLGSSPEDIEGLEHEEEYDALNDETFGTLEGTDDLEDWEAQHEQLAEIAESSRHSNNIESFLEQLSFTDDDVPIVPKDNNVWAYNEPKNGDKSYSDSNKLLSGLSNNNDGKAPGSNVLFPIGSGAPRGPQVPKLRTVEELERMLLNQSKPNRFPPSFAPQPSPWPSGGMVRVMGRPPPGFVPYPGPPPHPPGPSFPMPPHFNFPPPPRVAPIPPGMLPGRPPPKHGYPHPPGPYFNQPPQHRPPMHHPGFQQGYFQLQQQPQPPPPPPPQHQQQQQQQQQHQQVVERGGGDFRDEYAGLMNNREKQWLLNIQLLQVNTGTPYFDDYYYTVFKERQVKNSEHRVSGARYHNRGNIRGSANQVQEAQNPVKKTYTPLQFENSLGKLQFGSVTAPRKIIDMDIIATNETDGQVTSRDSRKTKQLLLELEALYTLLLKAEDLRNPIALANQEKLVELRQKQRLREMDAAPTPEQKQEVLKLLQAESQTPRETPQELLSRLLSSLLDVPLSSGSDRLTSFLAVRKGKMLLLRALPQFDLYGDVFNQQIRELWGKILAALAVVGRRDSSGDNIIIKYYPIFKKFISTTDFNNILELISNLTETIKIENSRSTPLSHQSKAPIHFIVQNKFGISALASILQKVASLLPNSSEKQRADWSAFLTSLVDALTSTTISSPLELLSDESLNRHVKLITDEKKQILEKIFAENI